MVSEKMKTFFKKLTGLFLVLALFAGPFFGLSIKRAEANTSLSSYVKNLAPMIAKMPGCQKALGADISNLFGKVKDLFSSKDSGLDKLAPSTSKEADFGDSGGDSVTVSDENLRAEIQKTNEKLDAQKKSQDLIEKNQNCLNGIGKMIANVLVNKSTDSIINWINTGNGGDPMFIQDQSKYFEDIAKQEFYGFGQELNDSEKFPFAKSFLKIGAESYKNKFQNNAEYSMDSLLRDLNPNYSSSGFSQDFSQGGWYAMRASTQNPANNPFGFALMASNELAKRVEEKTTAAAGSLQMSGGYLGVEKCADPEGVTKEEDQAAKEELARLGDATGPTMNRVCKRWETVTPGKLVGEELAGAIQKKDNNLMKVETLNDAMSAILDSALAKFTTSMQVEGLAKVERPSDEDYFTYNQNVQGIGYFQNEQDYSNAQINSSKWLKQNPDFNIRTDLTQGLIDEQRIYADKLKEQNKEIFSKVAASDNYPLGNYGLVPTIYQLDYCIPGPHPGWEDDAENNLEIAKGTVIDTAGMNFLQIAQATGFIQHNAGLEVYLAVQALPFVGGSITGPDQIDNYVQTWFGTGDSNCGGDTTLTACVNTKLNTATLEKFTHIKVNNHVRGFGTTDGLFGMLDEIFNEYIKAINKIYIPEVLPSVTKEAKTLFEKVPNYSKIYNDNKKTIDSLNGTVARITQIKEKIYTLNRELLSGNFTETEGPDLSGASAEEIQAEYEEELAPWKLAFTRLSQGLYSGDDIAEVDTLTKQITDERDYIFNRLIKGPTGCEKEIESSNKATTNETRRMPLQLSGGKELDRPDYPLPILYKYPNLTDKSGFLWYAGYSNWGGSPLGKVRELCEFYEQFGLSSSGECETNEGPNFLKISDGPLELNNIEELTMSSTKVLGGTTGNFERDVLKVW